MPSTLVHVAFAGLIGCALLGDHFDEKAILFVMALSAVSDLDAFLGLWMTGAHRTVLHTLLFPGALAALVGWDLFVRERSAIRERWGTYGIRVAGVSIFALVVAQILLDAFYNGVNLFWPLYDQFIDLSGKLLVSDQRGIVQTFYEVEETQRGGRDDVHYWTGVDPTPGDPPEDEVVERIFPIAESGEHLLLTLTGLATVAFRIVEERRARG